MSHHGATIGSSPLPQKSLCAHLDLSSILSFYTFTSPLSFVMINLSLSFLLLYTVLFLVVSGRP